MDIVPSPNTLPLELLVVAAVLLAPLVLIGAIVLGAGPDRDGERKERK